MASFTEPHRDTGSAADLPPHADVHDVIDCLNDLIHLDFDAIAAYRAAIDRISDTTSKRQLGEFMRDHERHTQNLGDCVRSLGGTPATSGDVKQVLTKGKVVMANLAGDKAILKAMKSNEDQTNEKYEKALKRSDFSPQVRTILEQNLSDERRHRAWIISRIDQI